ncbi:MAG: PilN domain-containing protein [Fimbriimonas sp.]|nr:PilN domain-containing protein [Fimbriimonas sp.]
MPFINLIESDLIVAKKAAQQMRLSQTALVVAGSVVGIAYLLVLGQGALIAAEEKGIQIKLKKLKPMLKAIDEQKRIIADLEPRLETLSSARDLTSRWGRLLNHITVNTPPDVYLTAIRADSSQPDQPIKVTFVGTGKSQSDASQFVLRCQNSQDLEGVNLIQSQEKLLRSMSAIEFEIAGSIVGTAPKPVAEDGAKS